MLYLKNVSSRKGTVRRILVHHIAIQNLRADPSGSAMASGAESDPFPSAFLLFSDSCLRGRMNGIVFYGTSMGFRLGFTLSWRFCEKSLFMDTAVSLFMIWRTLHFLDDLFSNRSKLSRWSEISKWLLYLLFYIIYLIFRLHILRIAF